MSSKELLDKLAKLLIDDDWNSWPEYDYFVDTVEPVIVELKSIKLTKKENLELEKYTNLCNKYKKLSSK